MRAHVSRTREEGSRPPHRRGHTDGLRRPKAFQRVGRSTPAVPARRLSVAKGRGSVLVSTTGQAPMLECGRQALCTTRGCSFAWDAMTSSEERARQQNARGRRLPFLRAVAGGLLWFSLSPLLLFCPSICLKGVAGKEFTTRPITMATNAVSSEQSLSMGSAWEGGSLEVHGSLTPAALLQGPK